MGKALYRKYRSKSLDSVIGQEHITKTLQQAIKQGRISHAYLFTGPRGVGKTSVARILAHEINGLAYDDDSAHLDIIEIDAASNRRIDEIRDLRDKVHIAPTSAKYKVYIIDEVHMLTREAFNALLKTLEEPPEHVVFILATTDAHKLPETIISRAQRFSFKPAKPTDVTQLLKHIAKEEGITASDEALALLAEHGGGSFRDSVSLFDQAASHGQQLEVDSVRQLLGIAPDAAIKDLLNGLATQQTPAALVQQLTELETQGYQPAMLATQLAAAIREQLLAGKPVLSQSQALQLLHDLLDVPTAHDPARYLEICLLRSLPVKTTSHVAATPQVTESPAEAEPVHAASKPTPPAQAKPAKAVAAGTASFDADLWPEILQAIKQRHNTLYSIVRMAEPHFGDGTLELRFAFAFHQKRLNTTENRQVMADIIHALTGETTDVTAVVDPSATAGEATAEPTTAPDLAAISNIFGGGELLES